MARDLFTHLMEIYDGSDAAATTGLYRELTALGPAGELAMNLFRAQKASSRAKVYRGGVSGRGSYRKMAYERKEWALGNLVAQLARLNTIRFGWQADPATAFCSWVLYVDLPTGQVSFHAPTRGAGPEYDQAWDGVVNASPGRILRWCEQLLTAGAEVRV